MKEKILKSILKFDLNLNNKNVLTEAASGNYIVSPIIAAASGAYVYALFKETKYGTYNEISEQIYSLAKQFNVEDKINIITSYNEVDLSKIDILTNTGFNRPINKELIDKLSSNCVIPLMWEPWEYRPNELDLDYCAHKGIKVYGTNEADPRLKTMDYIGYIVLNFLLQEKRSPFSSKVLVLGNEHFTNPIHKVLKQNNYNFTVINDYNKNVDTSVFDVIVFAEHKNNNLLLGNNAYINNKDLDENKLLIHIAGNIEINNLFCKIIPKQPSKFGYMSFTTDYIDNMAVIDLHTAGLKVAEGMLDINSKEISGNKYKVIMEDSFPALAFENKKYW